MKRILIVCMILVALVIVTNEILLSAGSYGFSGLRTNKNVASSLSYSGGWFSQNLSIDVIPRWWAGTTAIKDTIIDTSYTAWFDMGSTRPEEFYALRSIVNISQCDTFASLDSVDSYSFAIQSCLNPTLYPTYITTVHTFAALTDTGTGVFLIPADSTHLYTYWAPWVRGQLIFTLCTDTVVAAVQSYGHRPILYNWHFKPIFK